MEERRAKVGIVLKRLLIVNRLGGHRNRKKEDRFSGSKIGAKNGHTSNCATEPDEPVGKRPALSAQFPGTFFGVSAADGRFFGVTESLYISDEGACASIMPRTSLPLSD